MTDETGGLPEPNPWHPMRDPADIRHLGKLLEELGECTAAVSRCLIQGIDEHEPVTGKPNRQWLREELADVLANVRLVANRFFVEELDMIEVRAAKKQQQLQKWHAMVEDHRT